MEYDKKMIHRLKRVEGQVRAVLRMMDEGKDCRDVVTQISAARNALDRVAALVVSTNLEACIREDQAKGQDSEETIREAVNLLVKSR
ncbi:metal-sensitive transcriptional regulator [Aciduricibacillus chroicocephali]|uniref:Metal-sensitive transcriptional regulator n=1 Tax=Aciduricibacillus chroicocephali TaxID=3054939 RepID=A0ABY9KT33_9BACI|nr:metal-sensitive transcriptional regulator [Bacillaceae bacterium 44XB]